MHAPFSRSSEDAGPRDRLALDRTALANERTLLAYIRTSLALLGAGAGLLQFFHTRLSTVLGWGFIVVSVMMLLFGIHRFATVRSHLARALEPPGSPRE